MTGKPYRLPESTDAGRLIDRTRPVSFTFDGRKMTGFAGDTLAAAVMANGQRLLGRSFKYHRPRGLVGLGAEEPNALVGVGEGERHEPNLRATQVELYDGMVAVSQNRWPNLDFDIGAFNNRLSRLCPSGVYYKTFMGPQSVWKSVYEPVIRHAAGLGTAPTGRDPDTYEQLHVHCDVLVVGAGVTGLAAAEAAAAAGAKVIIADENPQFGGIADIAGDKIAGKSPNDWTAARVQQLAKADNVHVLARTTVAGHFHHNFLLLFERVADHDRQMIADGVPRHRLWKVRANQIIVASGAIERPIAFANNDRPGVMLASAARGLVERYGVAPGLMGVVFANNDDAYRTALSLKRAGVGVARIIDVRQEPDGPLVEAARGAGLEVMSGHAIAGVETGLGGKAISAVKAAPYSSGQGRVINETRIECDFVAMSGGWNPAVHLWCHNGGKLKFDTDLQSFVPDRHSDAMHIAGAANGRMSARDCIAEGYAVGENAARAALPKAKAVRVKTPKVEQESETALEPIWF
ncbi:MAG: FAD-dependent oxidoreductase, partial [Aestuariivirgaceae bacterium]